MGNKLFILILAIIFLIGGVVGFAVKGWTTPPLPKERTVYIPQDRFITEYKTKIIKGDKELIEVPIPISVDKPVYIETFNPNFSDSISGVKDSIEYNVVFQQKKISNDSLERSWIAKIKDLKFKEIKEIIITELKEVALPFYEDGWFWSSFIAIPLLLLAIIF